MDKSFSGVMAVGIPFSVLYIASKLTGCHGAAAFTKAISSLGGRFGMFGGAGALLAAGAAAGWSSEKLIDVVSERVIKWRVNQGESKENIIREIQKLPLSKKLKDALTYRVQYAV